MLQTLRRRPLAAALPLSLAFLSGCDVQFPEQEVRMQYDTEADTLDVLFIYKGVHTPETSAEALNDGKNVADRILAGRREFMLLDWPYLWDLDELAEDESQVMAVHRIIERVSLVEVGAFLDPQERLSSFQHFRMTEVADTLGQANQLLTGMVQLGLLTGEIAGQVPWMDDEEQDAWGEFCQSGTPWVAIEDNQIVVRVPATERGAAAMLRALMQEAAANEAEPGSVDPMALLLDNLSGFQAADGVATLTFGGQDEGVGTLQLNRAGLGYDPTLHKHLRNNGLDLEGAPDLAAVRARLGG